MLEFFRKYQRFFMILVAVIIVISFSFFGAYVSMDSLEKKKDFVVGKAIDGSDLRYSEVRQLSSLMGMQGSGGLFDRAFLKTGTADLLSKTYFDALQGEWRSRLSKARAARFYVHPAAPFLDARGVWSQLAPGLIDEVQKLQSLDEADSQFFSIWSNIYSLQQSIPSELVRRVLLYQQNQAGLPMDSRLLNIDFALFDCKTLEDWFGRNFIDLASQVILNGAALAKQQGMKVSKQDAEADFAKHFDSKQRELQNMGISRSEALRLWQKALGYLRWSDEVGEAALIDPLPFQSFNEFAGEQAVLKLYSLPEELRFSTIDDLLAFEVYARIACSTPETVYSLPKDNLSAQEVAKKAPELTAVVFRARIAKVDPSVLGASLSLREVWDWQVDEKNWGLLRKAFPRVVQAADPDSRFAALEELPLDLRRSVDLWSRLEMVLQHPEWIETAFSANPGEEREIFLSDCWVDGVEAFSSKRLKTLLSAAAAGDPSAIEALKAYREGNGPVLRITEVEQVRELCVLSFKQAKEQGRIPIERFLEEEYRRLSAKSPSLYKKEDGSLKPLKEVRELVICSILRDLFKAIDKVDPAKEWEEGSGPLDHYASHRFQELMRRSLISLQQSETPEEREKYGLGRLWQLKATEKTIERNSSEEWMQQQAYLLQPGEWSTVHVPSSGEIVFFFLQGKMISQEPVLEQMQFAKEALSKEAKRRLADRLLEIAMQKQALTVPLRIEGETHDHF